MYMHFHVSAMCSSCVYVYMQFCVSVYMHFRVSVYTYSFVCLLCICIFMCLLCTVLSVYGSNTTHDMLPSLKHAGSSQPSNVLMRSTDPDVKTRCFQIDMRYNYSNRYEV